MTPNLDAALAALDVGRLVFPVRPDKRPATVRGYLDATDDERLVRSYWRTHPAHMVGTPTSGFFVVDLDVHSEDANGLLWLDDAVRWPDWPAGGTLTVRTPSGGKHLHFTPPPDVDVRNSASVLAPGVDVRGTGGYVVAPGSQLPDGRRYEVEVDAPIAAAPGQLLEALQSRRAGAQALPPALRASTAPTTTSSRRAAYGLAALRGECETVATTPAGGRNHALNVASFRAGQLVASGFLDAHTAADHLYGAALRAGLGGSEAEATVRSGLRAGVANPRSPAA